MSTIPAPHAVTRAAFTPGSADAHGNPIPAWGTPASVSVHAFVPPGADTEPDDPARSAVVRDLDLYAPAGTVGLPQDRWVVGGVTYEQVGYPEDFTHGPWATNFAGVRINLKRVEG